MLSTEAALEKLNVCTATDALLCLAAADPGAHKGEVLRRPCTKDEGLPAPQAWHLGGMRARMRMLHAVRTLHLVLNEPAA